MAGAIQKISMLEWINGELDCAGGTAPDCVSIQNLGNSLIEFLHFQGVAIEDAQSGNHPGCAVNTNGTGGVSLTSVILAGMANNIVN
jgi:hypothetical protein